MIPTDFPGALYRINNGLESNSYSSIDPILLETHADSAEKAISILENAYNQYSKLNFHPLAAHAARCLAAVYKFEGKTEQWLKLTIKCLSPIYQRYLGPSIQGSLLSQTENTEKISISIQDIGSSPFAISFGFLNYSSKPSEDIPYVLAVRSLLSQQIHIDSILINLKHSQDNIVSFTVIENVDLFPKKIFKFNSSLNFHHPGILSPHSEAAFTIVIHKINITIPISSEIGHHETSVLPINSDCRVSFSHLDYGITNIPFKLAMACNGVPKGASNFIINAKVVNATFSSNEDQYHEEIAEPESSFNRSLILSTPTPAEVTISINWSYTHETVNFIHDKAITIKFCHPFSISTKFFSPERLPFKEGSQPFFDLYSKYLLVLSFEYNLPAKAILSSLEVAGDSSFDFEMVPFDNNVSIDQGEAFSSVIFITGKSVVENQTLGKFIVQYQIDEDSYKYEYELPPVSVKSQKIKAVSQLPNEADYGKESTLLIDVENITDEGIDGTFSIMENKWFVLSGETQQMLHLDPHQKQTLEIGFVPMKPGRLIFPLIRITEGKDISLWEARPSLYVNIVETTPSE